MRVVFSKKIDFNGYRFINCFVVQKRFLLFFWKTVQAFQGYTMSYRCGYLVETHEVKKIKKKQLII